MKLLNEICNVNEITDHHLLEQWDDSNFIDFIIGINRGLGAYVQFQYKISIMIIDCLSLSGCG